MLSVQLPLRNREDTSLSLSQPCEKGALERHLCESNGNERKIAVTRETLNLDKFLAICSKPREKIRTERERPEMEQEKMEGCVFK